MQTSVPFAGSVSAASAPAGSIPTSRAKHSNNAPRRLRIGCCFICVPPLEKWILLYCPPPACCQGRVGVELWNKGCHRDWLTSGGSILTSGGGQNRLTQRRLETRGCFIYIVPFENETLLLKKTAPTFWLYSWSLLYSFERTNSPILLRFALLFDYLVKFFWRKMLYK